MKYVFGLYEIFGLCYVFGHRWERWWQLPTTRRYTRSCRACFETEIKN